MNCKLLGMTECPMMTVVTQADNWPSCQPRMPMSVLLAINMVGG